jgi:predicted AlkP superfamily pyrophosphatase or phosphodiesterase
MKKTVVLNVVGLTSRLMGTDTPFLTCWADSSKRATINTLLPAVTCSVQATYLTGKYPEEHGIVGNGWYFKDECEIKFWKQSNKLVESPKIWETAKSIDSSFTCANMFWWYNMYSNADFSVTPRPQYLADGRKMPDVYSNPPDLRDILQNELGTFPLFDFWGPRTSIRSSQWIADASMLVDTMHDPTLTLIYLPHLDYNLQRFGPNDVRIKKDLREIDAVCEELICFYEKRGAEVIVLSEYGITEVSKPIALNRILRKKGYLAIREERGLELLDPGASKAFAVADHQVAHIYVNDKSILKEIKKILTNVPGVEKVLDEEGLKKYKLTHERTGDLVVVADKDSWFSYYYWLEDAKAPDFARIVDIHKKPGYDPVEMLVNPKINFVTLKVLFKLLKKRLGFRMLMDLIPLDDTLIKGSHGRDPESNLDKAVFLTKRSDLLSYDIIEPIEVHDLILSHLSMGKSVHNKKVTHEI